MKQTLRLIVFVMLLGEAACHDLERSRSVDDPAVAGRTIALQVCSNCHGVNGVSVSPMFPKLAAQPREYLVAQLTDFRAHRRADLNAQKFMWGFRHLSEAQIEQLAAYFSTRPPPPATFGNSPLVDVGRAIYMTGIPNRGVAACSACHGANGEGLGETPRLAGQHADYIMKQLMVFRHSGQRPRGDPMKPVSDHMSEQDMRSVAAFLEALPAPSASTDGRTTARLAP
jgi:cytochrome c553